MSLVRKALVVLLCPLFQAIAIQAQDQTVTISDPPRMLDGDTTNLVAPRVTTLTVQDAGMWNSLLDITRQTKQTKEELNRQLKSRGHDHLPVAQ